MRVMPAVIWRSSTRLIAGNRLFAAALIPALALRVAAELGYRWQSWFNDSFSLRPRRGDADAEHDAALRLPPLPVAAVPRSQLSSRDRVAAPDGAARRRDDLRARQAPVRRARLGRRPGHAAGALRRVRDPARAPDHGGHAVPVPGDGRGHRRACGRRARRGGPASRPGCCSGPPRSSSPPACRCSPRSRCTCIVAHWRWLAVAARRAGGLRASRSPCRCSATRPGTSPRTASSR